MRLEKINNNNVTVTFKDDKTGAEYNARVLAFKNGVLYLELILDKSFKPDESKRLLAIRAAKYFRSSNPGLKKSLAAKISIFCSKVMVHGEKPYIESEIFHDSTIGIIFQDGLLN